MPITLTDINNIIPILSGTYKKDAFRISLFMAVSLQKATELVESNPAKAVEFTKASSMLIGDWTQRTIDVAKNPVKFLFSDPFKGLRTQTRVFMAKWELADVFIQAMG